MEEISDPTGVWYRTRVESDTGVSYEAVAAVQDQMGPLGGYGLTARLIDRWDPAYIVLVGIAGSFSKDVRLGDVVVSQQVFHFDPGKATDQGISYRPQGYPSSVSLTRQLEALRQDRARLRAWQSESARFRSEPDKRSARRSKRNAMRGGARPPRPEIHFGTVASGSLVIAGTRKQIELLKLHGKILATEMEGAGVMHAAFFHREQPTAAIIIKGISDHADRKKAKLDAEESWRDRAAANSVGLLLSLLKRGRLRSLQTDEFAVNVTASSPTRVRDFIKQPASPGVAMLAFDELVTPRGPLTRLLITVSAEGTHDAVPVLEGVVAFTSIDGKRVTNHFLGGACVLDEPVAPNPVGIYLLFSSTPKRVSFTIATSGASVTHTWTPSLSAR
jgi:nucleoside phosphorylase